MKPLKAIAGIASTSALVVFLLCLLIPITIRAATFGNPTIGASSRSDGADTMRCSSFLSGNAPYFYEASSISFYQDVGVGSKWKGLVVASTSLSIINNGIGVAVDGSGVLDWATSTFSNPLRIEPNTKYFLCLITDDAIWNTRYDAADSGANLRDNSNSFTSPVSPTDATFSTDMYSVYVTYEEVFANRININNGTIRINNGTIDL